MDCGVHLMALELCQELICYSSVVLCVCMRVSMLVPSKAEIPGVCELPDMGAKAQVLWRNNTCP